MSAIAASWYRQTRMLSLGEEEGEPVAVLRMDPECGVASLPVLEEFRRTGCFQLELSPELLALNERAFVAARRFMDLPEAAKESHRSVAGSGGATGSAASTAPGSLNGFHSKGGLSRYNEHRSGFIFEDETVLDLVVGSGCPDGNADFAGSITA